MVGQTPSEGRQLASRYLIGAIIGAVVFVALPETARRIHGGAFAEGGSAPASADCQFLGGTNYGTINCSQGTKTPIPDRGGLTVKNISVDGY